MFPGTWEVSSATGRKDEAAGGCKTLLYSSDGAIEWYLLVSAFERFLHTHTAPVHTGKALDTSSKAQASQSQESNEREM